MLNSTETFLVLNYVYQSLYHVMGIIKLIELILIDACLEPKQFTRHSIEKYTQGI